jgi:hypothetical protein
MVSLTWLTRLGEVSGVVVVSVDSIASIVTMALTRLAAARSR